jgi:GAF domain-containing protein
LNVVIPIGIALSSEKDFNQLLERILLEAKSFCNADAGILYLRTPDDHLKFEIIRNDSRQVALGGTTSTRPPFEPLSLQNGQADTPGGTDAAIYAALTGRSINIANPDGTEQPSSLMLPLIFDVGQDHYRTISLLTIPLKNSQEHVIGVLQLINARSGSSETEQIIPFDHNLQQMMESLSSLAVAALEAYIREQSLRQEIQELRIEIDEAKRKQHVSEIVDTELFQDLQSKARTMRSRRRQREESDKKSDHISEETSQKRDQ